MEPIDDEEEHAQALLATGFWGRRGAGCVVMARSTGRFLVGLRSEEVLEPGTWGTWGGAVPAGAELRQSVLRELAEETDYSGEAELVHAWCFVHPESGFRYDTFVAVVDDEFEPVLNWEHDDYVWVAEGEWPSPLHFGLQEVLGRVPSLSALCGREPIPARCRA